MTADDLARAYFLKARKRIRVLEVLYEEESWSDVVREAQELVELALKGMLRAVGVDPPKWHDVGKLLVENAGRFPVEVQGDLERCAEISRWLRKDRELSFCGDTDFVPTEQYSRDDADRALADARFVLSCLEAFREPS